ncbi:MAG: ABC transporter substrate-binding protein [Peptoniphilaceae bacterium]|nr:ABC transporter substrate-binding protein [Peptoniphilaceae bacterium]MDY6019549.1 ABC transporter substrate-binding protein [Anaerococcus sp.]
MKTKRILAFLLAFTLVLTACGKAENKKETDASKASTVEGSEKDSGKEGGLMILGIGSDPTSVNPLFANDRVSLTISNVLYDNLYHVKKGKIVYDGLAQSMTSSDDHLTYTLKLKKGIKWHDGKAITADDVIFTYDTILDDKQNAKGQNVLKTDAGVVKYSKVDDMTIEYKLPKVDATFVDGIAEIVPIPKHVFEGEAEIAKSPKNAQPIGSGPFKFKEQKTGELYQVERFEDYYGDLAKLDGIAYKVIPDTNASMVALEKGEISVSYIKPKDVAKFKNNDNFEIITFPEGMVDNLFFRVDSENLKDVKVRQAISYAIDKTKLIQGTYLSEDYADPAYSAFATNTGFFTDDVEKYEFNVEKAKKLLKEANKENLDLKLMYTSGSPAQEKEGLLIQEMLKEVGINVELIPMERATFIEKLLDGSNHDFDMAINGYVMGDNPDSYASIFTSNSSENFSNYKNPKIDQLFDQAKLETDEAKRGDLYKEIQQILAKDAVEYPVANVKSILAVRKEFKNLDEAKPAPIHMFDYFNKIELK